MERERIVSGIFFFCCWHIKHSFHSQLSTPICTLLHSTDYFFSLRVNNVELYCFLCRLPGEAVERTVELFRVYFQWYLFDVTESEWVNCISPIGVAVFSRREFSIITIRRPWGAKNSPLYWDGPCNHIVLLHLLSLQKCAALSSKRKHLT